MFIIGGMGVHLDKPLARERLEEALALALSDFPVPEEWTERAKRVSEAAQITFTPMLGTALLGKATNDGVSALSLKEAASHNSYSARGLAHQVLVPFCVEREINIRTTGAEPLNNQPFFRYDTVHRGMKVRNKRELEYLVETLESADWLRGREALEALAAFLRVRLADPRSSTVLASVEGVPDPRALIAHAKSFVTQDPEGGKRGQALGAALLDLVFPQVSTTRINDPSRHWPGDIVLGDPTAPALLAEVRQKKVAATEVIQFVERLDTAGIPRGLIIMFAPAQPELPLKQLRLAAWEEHAVNLNFIVGIEAAIHASLAWTPMSLDDALRQLVARMHFWVQEFDCAPGSAEEWILPFADGNP